jgi:hypothetical protein
MFDARPIVVCTLARIASLRRPALFTRAEKPASNAANRTGDRLGT